MSFIKYMFSGTLGSWSRSKQVFSFFGINLFHMCYSMYKVGWSWFPGKKRITNPVVDEPLVVHPETAYIELQKSRLLATFLCEHKCSSIYNANIDPCFYDIEKYDAVIQDPKNELEASWKRRILMETTPRGCVMMYYDAFKHGFAYYSDHYIPSPLINAVAMKYVVVYRCRDFFLDETILFDEKQSPFVRIQEQEERATRDKKAIENKEKGLAAIDVRTGPFAKLKQFSGAVSEKPSLDVSNTDAPTVLAKNRIIHLGKWVNFNVLNRTGIPKVVGSGRRPQPEIPMKFKDYMTLKMQVKA